MTKRQACLKKELQPVHGGKMFLKPGLVPIVLQPRATSKWLKSVGEMRRCHREQAFPAFAGACAVAMACICGSAGAAQSSAANDYPSRSIRIVVGQAPGGGQDIIVRALAQNLAESLGKPVVVDNRPGASGTIGSALVAKAEPDGYTVLAVAITFSTIPSLYKSLPFDPVRDLRPLTMFASTPLVLLVNPSVPVKNVRELIAYAKEKPGQLNFGSGGVGNTGHLAATLFTSMAGIQMTHIPYKGAGLAMTDLLGGQLQLMFDSLIQGLPYAKNRRLTALGVTTAQRAPVIPELPTVAEAGLPGYDFSGWYGLMVPAGTSNAIVDKLYAGVERALNSAEFKQRMAQSGSEPIATTPDQFAARLASEMATWQKVVKAGNMQIE
jgi:tripartite-type tricarboxylate transporter receptor subunit TctC